jgi:hypothetical protein
MANTKTAAKRAASTVRTGLSPDDMREIAMDALIYAYPLVLMEMTRRAQTNVEEATTTGTAPMNQFSHIAAFPDPNFTLVVRPNADTLYSMLWFDVSKEPLVINVPDSCGRYYLLQLLDMWTDVFESIGPRTTGTAGQRFMIASPTWTGNPPAGAAIVRSPTSIGWLICRTQTNGVADYPNVHAFQRGITAVPLSQAANPESYVLPCGTVRDAWVAQLPPVEQVEHMNAETFLTTFGHASRGNPPHANDYPVLHRMRRVGLEPGKTFSFGESSIELRRAIAEAWPEALARIKASMTRLGTSVNGWRINLTGAGTYGASYLQRAAVAYAGLGANTVDDAVYPAAFTDADGDELSSDARYVIHFDKGQLPPVRAFWSLTMYDARQLFAANPLDRFAVGDRDALAINDDGSLDIYIQQTAPADGNQANWLPAPANGPFSLVLRLYWPTAAVTSGAWQPPPICRVIRSAA